VPLAAIPHSEVKSKGTLVVNTPEQIEIMREAGRIGREVLDIASAALKVGVTPEEIDKIVFQACVDRNVYPSPLNYHGFPKSVCV
jgi:methionyl aminopeptidase